MSSPAAAINNNNSRKQVKIEKNSDNSDENSESDETEGADDPQDTDQDDDNHASTIGAPDEDAESLDPRIQVRV
jgi:hypothetical protein